MRKITLLTVLTLLLQGCATTGYQSRKIAGFGSIFSNFIESAVRTSDNVAAYLSKKGATSIDDLVVKTERKVLADMKVNPHKYGIPEDVNPSAWKSLDDAEKELGQKYDKVLADILSKADNFLGFNTTFRKAAVDSLQDYAGLGARVEFKSVGLQKVVIDQKFVTGLSDEASKKLQFAYKEVKTNFGDEVAETMLQNNIASAKQFKIQIIKETDASSKALLQKYADDILENGMLIERQTGQPFLGNGGCSKITGTDVNANFAEISHRTAIDADAAAKAGKKLDSDELSEALVKNHEHVTNRTKKEACFSIRELASKKGTTQCGGVFHWSLQPGDC